MINTNNLEFSDDVMNIINGIIKPDSNNSEDMVIKPKLVVSSKDENTKLSVEEKLKLDRLFNNRK